MEYNDIRKTLEEQLQLLSKRSHDDYCSVKELVELSREMVEISDLLLAP